jgi:hypothetical protein
MFIIVTVLIFEWWYFTMDGLLISEDDEQKRQYSTKKWRIYERVHDANKKIQFQSHETGAPCNWSRKCFDLIDLQKINDEIKRLNEMKSNLSNLITGLPVLRRRPRGDKIVNPKQVHYMYRVRSISE